ncbi:hypothetical protein AMTRI_Chr04g189170 [Amborella trichopoda]
MGYEATLHQFQPLARQSSIFNLALEELQSHGGDLSKALTTMNIDEFFKGACPSSDEAPGSNSGVAVTLEDFLQRAAGLVDENLNAPAMNPATNTLPLMGFNQAQALSGQGLHGLPAEFLQYPMNVPSIEQQQGLMVSYGAPMHVSGAYGVGGSVPLMDAGYGEMPLPVPSPMMGTSSDTQTPRQRWHVADEVLDKAAERRQKRMIKNRESAARSRARKQAYTKQLEHELSKLRTTNVMLKKITEVEMLLDSVPRMEPRYQLRRTSSAPF